MRSALHAHTENRIRLRRLLNARGRVISPVSVFDNMSAHMVEEAGGPVMQLAGSVASHVTCGAPDLLLATVDEVADLCARITRRRSIPLLVDADHGFGNALSVERSLEKLAGAGVSGLTLEDTILPAAYASAGTTVQGSAGGFALTNAREHLLKLSAAVACKNEIDPALCVFARSSSLPAEGIESLCERLAMYKTSGVDGFHLIGAPSVSQWASIQEAAGPDLPLIVSGKQNISDEELAACGVVFRLTGHAPFLAAMQAAYSHIQAACGQSQGTTLPPPISSEVLAKLLDVDRYKATQKKYLAIASPAAGMK
ncbi:Oxaloacetate decarboxylase [Diplonema papillatum]|nr:Oxaloacetate decarboxylase [Diplonema papillatum]|eukprot:gene22857-35030_t